MLLDTTFMLATGVGHRAFILNPRPGFKVWTVGALGLGSSRLAIRVCETFSGVRIWVPESRKT